jgi:O-antigen ligase
MTLLSFYAIYLTAMRNGMVVTLALSIIAFFFYLYAKKVSPAKAIALSVAAFIVIGVFGYSSVKYDKRWQTLRESIPIALDTETNKAWIDIEKYPYPKLKSGQFINPSNYLRVALLKEGLILASENPLGTGFSRFSYGRGINAKYGEGTPRGHSHSGILDLYLATGFPGTLLWIALIISLLYHAVKNMRMRENYFSMLLILTITTFSLRMMVDTVNRDNILHSFLFLVALFSVLIIKERKNEEN